MSMRGRGHRRNQGPRRQGDTREERDENRKRARMRFRFPMYFHPIGDNFHGLFPTFNDYLSLLPICLELWVFRGLFGLYHELIPLFEETYRVLITVKPSEDGMLLYLYGMRIERAFTLVLIVALACKLRMKRNRGTLSTTTEPETGEARHSSLGFNKRPRALVPAQVQTHPVETPVRAWASAAASFLARAWARGLQSPVRWSSRRYFI